ncbi:hypothetical protein PML89_09720 (plasmid) [Vagococcus lutrae]|uniref:hypothetical protein n=1 Tax=Vagococcus lutrae TaxID=81947 RepID=UPI00232CA582|nr:hypothetical protein [Vagococcus lutrae]WCG06106.1 hypothetical protein PML89_09720 [Vagococcus lutrae]
MEDLKLISTLLTPILFLFVFFSHFKIDKLNFNFNLSIKSNNGNNTEKFNQKTKFVELNLIPFMILAIFISFISTQTEKNALFSIVLEVLLKAFFS